MAIIAKVTALLHMHIEHFAHVQTCSKVLRPIPVLQVKAKSEPLKIILEAQYRPSQNAVVVEVVHMVVVQ